MKAIQTLLGQNDDASMLCEQLAAGTWVVEAGCTPPPRHDPAHLPAWNLLSGGTAMSLTTRTVLRLNIGPAVAGWLEKHGLPVGPLAGVALHELIVNAAVHGNLAVSSSDLNVWRDVNAFHAMIVASLNNASHAERLVTIALGWADDRVMAVIADEGGGYEPSAAATSGRGSGRGLRIAHAVGRIEVLDGGRQTVMTLGCPFVDVD